MNLPPPPRRNLFAQAMWKNASGSQKRKRKREKEKVVQASKCQKLDSFFICPAGGQYLMLKTMRFALSVFAGGSQYCLKLYNYRWTWIGATSSKDCCNLSISVSEQLVYTYPLFQLELIPTPSIKHYLLFGSLKQDHYRETSNSRWPIWPPNLSSWLSPNYPDRSSPVLSRAGCRLPSAPRDRRWTSVLPTDAARRR